MDHHIALGTINPPHKYSPPPMKKAESSITISSSKVKMEAKPKHFKNLPPHLVRMKVPFESTLICKKFTPKKKTQSKRVQRPNTASKVETTDKSKNFKTEKALIDYVKIGRMQLYEIVFPKIQNMFKLEKGNTEVNAFNAKLQITELYKTINSTSAIKCIYCKVMERDPKKSLDRIKESKLTLFFATFGCSVIKSQSIYRYLLEMEKKRSNDKATSIGFVILESEYNNFLKTQNQYSSLIGEDEINNAEEKLQLVLNIYNKDQQKIKQVTTTIHTLSNSICKLIEQNVKILSLMTEYQDKTVERSNFIKEELQYRKYFIRFVNRRPSYSEITRLLEEDYNRRMHEIQYFTAFYTLLDTKYKIGNGLICAYDLPKAITEFKCSPDQYKLIVKFINKVKARYFVDLIYNDPLIKPVFTENRKNLPSSLFTDYLNFKTKKTNSVHNRITEFLAMVVKANKEKIDIFNVSNPDRRDHVNTLFFVKEMSVALQALLKDIELYIKRFDILTRIQSIPRLFNDKVTMANLFEFLTRDNAEFNIDAYEEQANKENEMFEAVEMLNQKKTELKKATIAEIEGNYDVFEPKVSKYEAILPTSYYEKVIDQNSPSKSKDWYLRPHHVINVTNNPSSIQDDITSTKYISFYEECKKEEPTEKLKLDQNAIESLENQIDYLRAKLYVAKQLNGQEPNANEGSEQVMLSKASDELDELMKSKKIENKDLLRDAYESILKSLRIRELEAYTSN